MLDSFRHTGFIYLFFFFCVTVTIACCVWSVFGAVLDLLYLNIAAIMATVALLYYVQERLVGVYPGMSHQVLLVIVRHIHCQDTLLPTNVFLTLRNLHGSLWFVNHDYY